MKQLSLALFVIFLNVPVTNFCMKKKLTKQDKPQTIATLSKNASKDDNVCCSDLTFDTVTSCCAG